MFDKLCLNFEFGAVRQFANLVDLVKSFLTSIYYLFAKIGFDTAENEPFNFHKFSSLQGFNFHRGVVSSAARSPTSAESCPKLCR